MDRAHVRRKVLLQRDLSVSAVKEIVMDEGRNLRKSATPPAVSLVVRQFAGSRIERQVLVQAFDVIWEAMEISPPTLNPRPDGLDSTSVSVSQFTSTSRIKEGISS